MVLRNVHVLPGGELCNIHIQDQKIAAIDDDPDGDDGIDCGGALVFPGLINSHEHLEFNLFPQLGNKRYQNYTEWGKDIHIQNKKEIDEITAIPLQQRIQWGLYKNLLNGFTTVVNHGEKLKVDENIVEVLQPYSLHSVQFERSWQIKLNTTSRSPIVIHAGEGDDEASHKEITKLIRWNIFRKKIIAVHGIGMDQQQAAHFRALVWCPASNYFLFARTAAINELKKEVQIIFGTDSTLTSPWNAWDQLRVARKSGMVSDKELFEMITISPAAVWGLKEKGEIKESKVADIVVARRRHDDDNLFGSFYSLNPEDILLVLRGGEIKLIDESFYEQLSPANPNLQKMPTGHKYTVGDFSDLASEIKKRMELNHEFSSAARVEMSKKTS
jgi:cytosine/adenosine deaminase-related metal-dependent hydrolase